MTCIVGLISGNYVWMGADSIGSDGSRKDVRSDVKLFPCHGPGLKGTLISYTTSYRMGQLLMYREDLFDELSVLKNAIDHRYMVTRFIPKIQSVFREGKFGNENSPEGAIGGNFLVAHKNSLFQIYGDFQVSVNKIGYCADGGGVYYALGSLHSTSDTKMTAKERIVAALRAAAQFSPGVGGPFYVSSTRDCKVEIID